MWLFDPRPLRVTRRATCGGPRKARGEGAIPTTDNPTPRTYDGPQSGLAALRGSVGFYPPVWGMKSESVLAEHPVYL